MVKSSKIEQYTTQHAPAGGENIGYFEGPGLEFWPSFTGKSIDCPKRITGLTEQQTEMIGKMLNIAFNAGIKHNQKELKKLLNI